MRDPDVGDELALVVLCEDVIDSHLRRIRKRGGERVRRKYRRGCRKVREAEGWQPKEAGIPTGVQALGRGQESQGNA